MLKKENLALQKENLALKQELNVVKAALAASEKEVKDAKMAQLMAENDLKVQADLLLQTLASSPRRRYGQDLCNGEHETQLFQ